MKNLTRKVVAYLSATVLLTVTTLSIRAQDQAEDRWRFGVSVPLWAPSIDGNTTVHGQQQDANISFDQLKDHLDASFSLGLDASKGKFGIFSSVGYMKFSSDTHSTADGGSASADLKFVIANAGLSYVLVKTGQERPFILAGTAGIRYWYAETDLTLTDSEGNSTNPSQHKSLVDPVIGLRGSQYFTPKLHLDFAGDFGGFDISYDTDITWSASGVMTYDFAKWFSLSAGYSALSLHVENGSGTSKNGFDLTFHGPQIVAKFKF